MGYDLSVHVNEINDNIVPQWISEIRKFNMNVEIHPEFSFHTHSGFLPFKVVIYDCPNKELNNLELLTGYELYVNTMEKKRDEKSIISRLFSKKDRLNSIERKIKNANIEIIFNISAQDSFEFRIGWFSAASLAFICNGVLIDPQEDLKLEGNQLIRHAHHTVLEDEKLIQQEDWRIHRFEGW
ncbi:hypothetical protein SAMN02799630_03313 [Paenibacillus sp. UNCCL117]|uniref:hypothetical protein n=1 Tax=unclassified Paenibacillus TaxID=185978 RepID=UPI0008855D68|nr:MULTISPECIES: hypothetical protein [unclassified Paenibacillus]SDD72507.1 hypothetical protein SAMN04488602_112128 [Paenibacillus sp. cl123]SFW45737.1 hypothetical protein SAMN02799630_03313 [Paenibacillus sp. UNCCL117]